MTESHFFSVRSAEHFDLMRKFLQGREYNSARDINDKYGKPLVSLRFYNTQGRRDCKPQNKGLLWFDSEELRSKAKPIIDELMT